MPAAIPEHKREVIKVKLELGIKDKVIAKDMLVSERTIRDFKKNLKEYGSLYPPKGPLQGRPRKITAEMQEVYSQSSFLLSTKANS